MRSGESARLPPMCPGFDSRTRSPFLESSEFLETFRARKEIFSSSVSKKGGMYTPETSCMKGTSIHIKNTLIKWLCNRKVRDFAMPFRARKVSGAFEKRAPGVICGLSLLVLYFAPRGFSPGTPVFPSPQKPTFDLIYLICLIYLT